MRTYRSPKKVDLSSGRKNPALVWNVLTILVLVALLCVVSLFVLIFVNPNNNLNPFPPPTLPPTVAPPTPTITPRITLIPSWTPTQIETQGASTPQATQAPDILNTNFLDPTVTELSPTATPGNYPFALQPGSPSAIDGAVFHPEAGCSWTGVAGQATSLNDEAVKGLFVQLGGSLPGNEPVDKLVMTGLAAQYGPGGFEITIADKLFASSGALWVQLLDQQNLPVSDQIYFDTFEDCTKNLIIIYFDQVK